MDITVHLSAGEIVLILIVWAVVAPFIAAFGKAAGDDFIAWRKRQRDKKL